MKAKLPRTDFMLSPEVREAAAACGKHSDVATARGAIPRPHGGETPTPSFTARRR